MYFSSIILENELSVFYCLQITFSYISIQRLKVWKSKFACRGQEKITTEIYVSQSVWMDSQTVKYNYVSCNYSDDNEKHFLNWHWVLHIQSLETIFRHIIGFFYSGICRLYLKFLSMQSLFQICRLHALSVIA